MSKFLLIKNWDHFQPDTKLKDKNAKLPWIKDYTEKEFDAAYMKLTALQRYVLDALCRLRGRLGHEIPYDDHTWVTRLLHTLPRDSAHVPHAIRTLCTHGFLIEWNEQVTSREGEGDIENGELESERGEEASLRSALPQTLKKEKGVVSKGKSKAAVIGED